MKIKAILVICLGLFCGVYCDDSDEETRNLKGKDKKFAEFR